MNTPISRGNIYASQWDDICAPILNKNINQMHAHANGSRNFTHDPRASQGGLAAETVARWVAMVDAGRNVAKHFAYATYALYGITGNASPAYSAYANFYVDPARHQTHYNDVVNAISQASHARPTTGMSMTQVRNVYKSFSDIVVGRLNQQVPDLRVCHGSCHSSCHNSRGRR